MSEVSKVVRVRQQALNGTAVEYNARLTYETEKPFEIEALFMPPGQAPTRWTLSRDALLVGTYSVEPPQAGDVRIYTCEPAKTVHIDLHGQYGDMPWKAEMHLNYFEVSDFLRMVGQALPAKDMVLPEQVVDAAIAAILEGSDD